MEARPRALRTALCLCGGGIVGGMYELGALAALDDLFGAAGSPADRFGCNQFDVYVGTSAGSFLATALAAGVPARRLFRAALDDDPLFAARRTDIYRFDARQGLGIARDLARVGLRALGRALGGRFDATEVLHDLGAALPAGLFSLRHYERFLDRFLRRHGLPRRFAEVPRELYITANDLDSGHRTVFGGDEYADMPLATAICASSAIPLFFEPVRYRGRDYVDGAVGKVEHGDIAFKRGAELIVIVNPEVPFRNPVEQDEGPLGPRRIRDQGLLAVYSQAGKMSTHTKLWAGVRRYQAEHPQATLLLIEPHEEEADAFMQNPMGFSSRRRMLELGYRSTARRLIAEGARYQAAFARLDVEVDAARLQPPAELSA